MRFFHTTSNSGVPKHPSCSSIGRESMNASEPYKLSTPYLKQGNSSSRRYSETSPKSKMLENLSHARKLIKTQKDALLEIQNTLRLLGREQHSSLKSCGSNSDRIYLHALREISQRKHSHFNIFGYGHEPPIRIHLSKSARKSLLKSIIFFTSYKPGKVSVKSNRI